MKHLPAEQCFVSNQCFLLQILDVERMLAKSVTPADILAQETPQQQMENHPVIRTLYDHTNVSIQMPCFVIFEFYT